MTALMSSGAGDAIGEGEATIVQETAVLVDNGGAVVDHALTCPMPRLNVLLLDRLIRHQWDVGRNVWRRQVFYSIYDGMMIASKSIEWSIWCTDPGVGRSSVIFGM